MAIKILSALLIIFTLLTFNIWYVNHEIKRASIIKTVDINRIIDDYNTALIRQAELGKIFPEDIAALTASYLNSLNAVLKSEGGVILISQSVIYGGEDITDEIRQKIIR
jgi:phenylacetate-coenzyme A ligase PaaK-like adenylate-forming protein